MTPSLVVDGLIVLAVLIAIGVGWRQGAVASVLSLVGVIAGLVVGMAAAPFIMELTDQVALRFLMAIGVLVLLAGLGQLLGSSLGAQVRGAMKMRSSQRVDSAIGAVFLALATLLVAWLVSIPLASGVGGKVTDGIRESQVLRAVDRVAPAQLASLPSGLAAMLNESGLPPLVSPWAAGGSSVEVEAPAIMVEDQQLVESLRPSVIHVLGDANVCKRRLMGSGFVTQEDYVVTNAHVVAGTESVRLDTVLGIKEARVVYYNPDVDLAVLYAPDLELPPLQWASAPAASGDDAIVMGFPHSGPFTASPARVRDRITIAGPDIYAQGRVERDAYTVRGSIQQGNSGGPMVNAQGEVLGVIFGASVDNTDTGYAITASETRKQIGDISRLRDQVDTGACVGR